MSGTIQNALTKWFACELSITMADPAGDSTNTYNFQYGTATEAPTFTLGTYAIGNHSDGRKCESGLKIDSFEIYASYDHPDTGATIDLHEYEYAAYGSAIEYCEFYGPANLGQKGCIALNIYKAIRESQTKANTYDL